MGEDRDARIYPCERCGVMRSRNEGGTVFTVCDKCWTATTSRPAVERITFDAQHRDDGTMFVTSPEIQFFSAVAPQGDWATVFEIAKETARANAEALRPLSPAAQRDMEAGK